MKMFAKLLLFHLLYLLINTTNCGVLLWSNQNLQVSPLKDFTDSDLEELMKELKEPEVEIYHTSEDLLPEFERLLESYNTAFNPNGAISIDNATAILDREDLTMLENRLLQGTNVLSVLVVPNSRSKREATSTPVFYSGRNSKNVYSLLYSSRPLLLRTQNSSVELGDAILVTIDDKQSKNATLRLDATIPMGDEKYILQFLFTWQSGYWSLSTVRVKRTLLNSSINLTITEAFAVPRRFSYHCSGITTFTDIDRSTELLIADLQAQPDSKDGTFGDVYDCVDFMTTPILSGLFVSGILGVGLIVALLAISEIKTMDKLDNHKTKQLVVTVAE